MLASLRLFLVIVCSARGNTAISSHSLRSSVFNIPQEASVPKFS